MTSQQRGTRAEHHTLPARTLPAPLLHRLCCCNLPRHHRNERVRERDSACIHFQSCPSASDCLYQRNTPPASSLTQLKRVNKLSPQHEDALRGTCVAGVHPVLWRDSPWSHEDGKTWKTGRRSRWRTRATKTAATRQHQDSRPARHACQPHQPHPQRGG